MRELLEVFWDMCAVALAWLDYPAHRHSRAPMGILENPWASHSTGMGMPEGIPTTLVRVVEVSVKTVYHHISIYYWRFHNKDSLTGISH
jgi:hypothetical protein